MWRGYILLKVNALGCHMVSNLRPNYLFQHLQIGKSIHSNSRFKPHSFTLPTHTMPSSSPITNPHHAIFFSHYQSTPRHLLLPLPSHTTSVSSPLLYFLPVSLDLLEPKSGYSVYLDAVLAQTLFHLTTGNIQEN